MEKNIKRKCMNAVVNKLADKPYFQKVKASWPQYPLPSGMSYPCAFVYWQPSAIVGLTNEENRATLGFSVAGFVQSNEDLELHKADCADRIEEALHELIDPSEEFRTYAVTIRITRFDPGPLNLAELPLAEPGVKPPAGCVRVDGEIDFDYDILT